MTGQNPKSKTQNRPYLFLLIRARVAPDFTVQAAQHFARLLGVEDDAVGRKFQGVRPLEAFGVAEQVQPVDRQLRVFGQADDVVAQAATVGQFAGERGQRKLGRLRAWGRPGY
ncbi:hypothetical protein [Leptolyngbya sp. O-77]|uniref:hypothetical protein n=1 Tax=Leptolyngbya sp. O-77 TaxID=1080068 RepID=UPI0012E39763|nr:hypothetical protein [Leptolyngbya sp. O-77]